MLILFYISTLCGHMFHILTTPLIKKSLLNFSVDCLVATLYKSSRFSFSDHIIIQLHLFGSVFNMQRMAYPKDKLT